MLKKLSKDIQNCRVCAEHLPFAPRPVFRISTVAPILLVGQAPGIKVQNSGVPWDDASGDRLREWMDLDKKDFYNSRKLAIVPMGLCYPGKKSGSDAPPRPECAPLWMPPILRILKKRRLTLLIGQYAQKYFLADAAKTTLTETVKNWREYFPEYLVLPHPSPRNNIWLRKNPWFEKENLPAMKKAIHDCLSA